MTKQTKWYVLSVAALPGLRNSAGTTAASPCIIQPQAPSDSCILVIPLVGLSLRSPWQLFPLPLPSLGPSLAHSRLSCSFPNIAINNSGATIFRCLMPSVLFVSETNVFMVPQANVGCIAAFRGFPWGGHWRSSVSAARVALDGAAFAPVVHQLHAFLSAH